MLVTLNPFMPLPDCADFMDYPEYSGEISCYDLHRKIIALRVYLTLVILNFFFITVSTLCYIYRNMSAKWAQTSEPTIHLSNQIISKQWQTYSLKKRGLFGTILGAIGHLIFSTTVLLYQVIVTSFTCEIYLWGPIIGFYIWTYAIIWRTIRLHLLFRLSKLQQRFVDHSISEDKEYQWFIQHRGRAIRYHLFIFLVSCVVIAVVIIITEFTGVRPHGISQCEFYWGNYVVLSMVVFFFVVVVPFIIWYLRGDSDAHGIRRELWVTVAVGIPCSIMCIIWQVLFEYPTTSKPAGTRGVFGPSNWLIIVTTTGHIMSVVAPLFKTLSFDTKLRRKTSTKTRHRTSTDEFNASSSNIPLQKLDLTTDSLHRALDEPHLLRVLQAWAVKDFSVENILFYDRYLHLLHGIEPNNNNNVLDTPLGADQFVEVVDLYNTFIADQSPLQVNISHRARSAIDIIMEPLVEQHKKPVMTEYNIPLSAAAAATATSDSPYTHLPIELIFDGGMHHLKSRAASDLTMQSTNLMNNTPTITLRIFETARTEVFWNIFSGIFPKVVADYNSDS